jgi:hypothetical protein
MENVCPDTGRIKGKINRQRRFTMKVKALITFTDSEVEYRSCKAGNIYPCHVVSYKTGSKPELYIRTPGGDICLTEGEYEIIEGKIFP